MVGLRYDTVVCRICYCIDFTDEKLMNGEIAKEECDAWRYNCSSGNK